MQSRWRAFVKDYLTFSKKERNGIFITIFLSVLIYTIPRFWPVSKTHIEKDAFQKELAQLKISIDTSHKPFAYQRDDETPDYYRPKHYDNYKTNEGELFAFDPNTLDAAGWKRLGVREKTIHTIQNFVAKGYKFRQPDDIRKIYGLRTQEADRLVSYVRIAEKETIAKTSLQNRSYTAPAKKPEENFRTRIIEINTADTSDFIALPGIGSKLAARIVNFREKLGGFNSVNQMGETYGIPDSTFQKIKVRLQCANASIRKININTADANELKVHPYIKWNIANAIVNFRAQHGTYKSIEDLRKIEIIPDELFNKIAPYLVL
jgi:competence ComEA-like helix-hairpin-helix protein